jgi:hypothetical protein
VKTPPPEERKVVSLRAKNLGEFVHAGGVFNSNVSAEAGFWEY